ncbi:anti-phage dCTP deaminase [Oceanibaculum nanhaiense]|uniref:anti-phage dCTP deaminase n=1 Tax=Oceanibaculum nanhaiense TaxID=1909734 RepID=UPI000A3BF9FF|nr:anti-phage dCTP deaminase [Oceanibaculum nanhaiense]
MATKPKMTAANDASLPDIANISPTSKELVIGVVGHAGAGTSTAGKRICVMLEEAGYTVVPVKLSNLIIQILDPKLPEIVEGANEGLTRFQRASELQNLGDKLRKDYGGHALAVAVITKIKAARGEATPGESKLAFVLDSLKHPEEVHLLRQVYDLSFRLVAVHCDESKREKRLIGTKVQGVKYGGVPREKVVNFMRRDAKDDEHKYGQRVRDAFHLADFFLDNTSDSPSGAAMNVDIDRFIHLLLDEQLVRPTSGERAIYHAYAASLQSACLSRQVGAALMSPDGTLIATGVNDPPKFGGGIYDGDSNPDNRCFAWEFDSEKGTFIGCHNDRKKHELYEKIAMWMAENLSDDIAKQLVPLDEVMGKDLAAESRETVSAKVSDVLTSVSSRLRDMPGVKDAIEYSRAIHAEMTALLAAARSGAKTVNSSLYVTTYPCHNCARHLVAAGVSRVYFIEPYTKSLACELHSDAIVSELPAFGSGSEQARAQTKMAVVPYTGVGPRMYEDFFVKRGEIKESNGRYAPKRGGVPFYAVRLRELDAVEREAVKLIPEFETKAHVDAGE